MDIQTAFDNKRKTMASSPTEEDKAVEPLRKKDNTQTGDRNIGLGTWIFDLGLFTDYATMIFDTHMAICLHYCKYSQTYITQNE